MRVMGVGGCACDGSLGPEGVDLSRDLQLE